VNNGSEMTGCSGQNLPVKTQRIPLNSERIVGADTDLASETVVFHDCTRNVFLMRSSLIK
jgi:hypothetical protein